jgi:hypothetical protein
MISLSLLNFNESKSCDICGSGFRDATYNMGFAQSMKSNLLLIGLNGIHYNTQIINPKVYHVDDIILKIPLHYVHHIDKKWQAQISTEIQSLTRINAYNENQIWHSLNPGDLYFGGSYRLIDNRENYNTNHHVIWLIGANSKLPIGHYQIRDAQKRLLPMHLQAGNGSYGLGLLSGFAYRNGNWGINKQFQCWAYSKNELNYKQGFQIQGSLGLNYVFRNTANHLFVPQLAYVYQTFNKDIQHEILLNSTGSKAHLLNLQLEWIYTNFYANIQYLRPIATEIPNDAPNYLHSVNIKFGILIPEKK